MLVTPTAHEKTTFACRWTTAQGNICKYRECGVTCVCNAILSSYGFGNKNQWLFLYVFAFSCMLLTAAFILWTIRKKSYTCIRQTCPREVSHVHETKSTVKVMAGMKLVLPVYSNVMIFLAHLFIRMAVVWFIPPFLEIIWQRQLCFSYIEDCKGCDWRSRN